MTTDKQKRRVFAVFQGSVDPTCLNPDAEVWTSSHLTLATSDPAYLQSQQLWTHFSDALTDPEGNIVLRSPHARLFLSSSQQLVLVFRVRARVKHTELPADRGGDPDGWGGGV